MQAGIQQCGDGDDHEERNEEVTKMKIVADLYHYHVYIDEQQQHQQQQIPNPYKCIHYFH